MWLYFLKNLRDYLQEKEELKEINVYVGSSKKHNKYPYIELVRGSIAAVENRDRVTGGTFEFYIDFWARNDNAEQEAGYEKLRAMEEATEPAVYEWFRKLAATKNLATIAEITDIVSDVDEFRPLCASRFVIRIKYKMRGIFNDKESVFKRTDQLGFR